MMQVHSFKGQGRIFGFTENERGENLPAQYGPWAPFKVLKMTKGENQPGVNVDECVDDIQRYGFHLTDAHARITEQATSLP
jgi:hypothetical protein